MVRSSSQKERKKEIGDGAICDWRGGGGQGEGCVGLLQGKGDGETKVEEDESLKNEKISLFLNFMYFDGK